MGDDRGYFMRSYDRSIFEEHGLVTDWVQENQSYSKRKGVIRGLHFQAPPHTETKLVRVVQGAVLDVFVDLRTASDTYGKWGSVELSEEKNNLVYIPRGFAHGFCTLTETSMVQYKVDNTYTPQAEGTINWNDPDIGIHWPVENPLVSEKDYNAALFKSFSSPF